MKLFSKKDKQFIDELSEGRLKSIAITVLADGGDNNAKFIAGDIVNEAWLSYFEAYGHLQKSQVDVAKILQAITKNTALEYLRSNSRRKTLQGMRDDSSIIIPGNQEEIDLEHDMKYFMARCSPRQQFVINAENNCQHDNQQELVDEIAGAWKKKFKDNIDVEKFRNHKTRAKKFVIKLFKKGI